MEVLVSLALSLVWTHRNETSNIKITSLFGIAHFYPMERVDWLFLKILCFGLCWGPPRPPTVIGDAALDFLTASPNWHSPLPHPLLAGLPVRKPTTMFPAVERFQYTFPSMGTLGDGWVPSMRLNTFPEHGASPWQQPCHMTRWWHM